MEDITHDYYNPICKTPALLVILPENLYNQFRMNAEVLRLLLAICLIAMYVLAMLYLRRRNLRLGAYLFWGLFALSIPALGPFLVILSRPGSPHRTRTSAEKSALSAFTCTRSSRSTLRVECPRSISRINGRDRR